MRRFALAALFVLGCDAGLPGEAADASAGGISFTSDTTPGAPDAVSDTGPVALDTGGVITLDVSVDTAVAPDVPALPCAVDGTSCNDGDPCTAGDACLGGACKGVTVVCDDKLACTADVCIEGKCESSLVANFCLISGACWPLGAQNPASVCQKCDPSVSSGAWTSLDGPCAAANACGGQGLCTAGQCVATGASCADDGNPCTTAICEAAGCKHIPITGTCDDGNACTTGDSCSNGACVGAQTPCADDGNPCTIATCSAGGCTQLPTTGACDDGNPCTTGDTCQTGTCTGKTSTEVCSNGVDDDCDGATDAADTECGSKLGKPCGYHADCHPEGVCAVWLAGGVTCSARCGKQADCPMDQMCTRLPGSANLGFCEPAPATGNAVGSPCASALECKTGLCFDGACRTACFDETGCTGAETCGFFASQGGTIVSYCVAGGGIATGQPCSTDGVNFDGSFCTSGVCDLIPDNAAQWLCTPLCNSESDCQNGQECAVMAYVTQTSALAAPYHPSANGPEYDAITGCYTNQVMPGSNFLPDSTPCSADTYYQCKSNKCLPVGKTGDYRCTSYCATDADCALGMKCKIAPLALVSEYLVFMSEYGGQPVQFDANSYVQICAVP
jgi:hypothetical protein